LKRYFAAKRSVVRGVIDELFDAGKDKARQKAILHRFMPEDQVREKVDEAASEIRGHIEKEVANFFRSFEKELRTIAVESDKSQVGYKVRIDIANCTEIDEMAGLLKGLSVTSSVASGAVFAIVATEFLGATGTILGVGTANIWNPVGWGLLALGGVLALAAAAKVKKAKEKLKKARADAATKLSAAVDRTESDIEERLAKWVDAMVTKIKTQHIGVMDQYAQYAEKHLNELTAATTFLDSLNARMQREKFQSMIRRFLNDDALTATEVTEADNTVSVHLDDSTVRFYHELEKALSRVEEKSVVITRRSKCHN